jgi:hypothetical protein
MNREDQDRIAELLRQSLPPVAPGAEPARDLWPEVLRRLDAAEPEPLPAVFGLLNRPWFDWALAAGLAAFALAVPASIPVFLYCL